MPDQEAAEVNYSFGQRLSSARRALNLTQEQVAADLRLNVGLINALEEEDYSSLPAHMYIAGYLRNYARLLKIPVEPLLTALDNAQLESPPLISDVSRPRKASHSKLLVKLFALLLFVVVVAGIVSWVQSQNFALFSEKPVGVEKIEEQGLKALPAPLAEKPVDEPAVSEDATPEPETKSEPVVAVPVVEVVAKTEEVAIQESPVPELAAQIGKPGPVKNGVELVLRFTEDCWVEVKDSRGKRLAYDLYRGGKSKQVTGIPPFSIFLGNAAAVAIEYNGQPYDAREHIDRNLARFSLGREDDYKGDTE